MNTIQSELCRVAPVTASRNGKAARKARFEQALETGRSLLYELLMCLRDDPKVVTDLLHDEQCSPEHYRLAALFAAELTEKSGTYVPVKLHGSKRGVCGFHILDLLRQIVSEMARQKAEQE